MPMGKLLDQTGVQAWVRHAAGAASLLKLRGTAGYQTDFEKSLFLAQIGPIVSGLFSGTERLVIF